MKRSRLGLNPFLPSWEYIPDGEPHVFGDRVYLYGSHDRFGSHAFCLNDYVVWSAPVDDLTDFRCEGVIYRKTDDPLNADGSMCLYAPDVTRGPDGRYYLYYCLDKAAVVSVAWASSPIGPFQFYGYVHDGQGRRFGERAGDEGPFDPSVLTEGERTYLYTGFCAKGDRSRKGAQVTVLGPDMLTVVTDPVTVLPSEPYSQGTGFEGHEFFEAPSVRRRGNTYYFIYSSIVMHELCYAISSSPTEGFRYGGVVISNADLGIDDYKPASRPMAYGGNNHGSIVQILNRWYVFYHRHSDGTFFSRQACLESLEFRSDGSIVQAPLTSRGPNGGPLPGHGEYAGYLACHLFCREERLYTALTAWMDNRFPKVTQDGKDGDPEVGYVANLMDGATAGFRDFTLSGVTRIGIKVRGYCRGHFEVRTRWDGPLHGRITVDYTNVWTAYEAPISLPDGVHSLYFTYAGEGRASLASFTLEQVKPQY
jgi:arabinoxylan arabinofuranohydrolase